MLRYRSDVIKDQLGRHLDQLKATGLIRRWAIDKNAKGDGFNIAFWPGKGFFEDYQRYYIDKRQPQLRFQAEADSRTIQRPLELVAHFHHALGCEHLSFETHETEYADELLTRRRARNPRPNPLRHRFSQTDELQDALFWGAQTLR